MAGTITREFTYANGETIDPAENNANEIALYNAISGGLNNDNIVAGAAIAESKIAFNTSTGHTHDGSDSTAIPKGFVFTIKGTLTTGTSLAPLLVAMASQTISKCYLNVKTAPTGADLIIDIDKSDDNGATWTSIWNTTQANRATISASALAGTQTSFDTTSLSEGDLLRVNIDQVGSTVAGADLTITVKA